MADNPLLLLREYGQSVWYDNIERGLLLSGELAEMVERDGVVGVTSNPTIFQKAVAGSDHYDATIEELAPNEISTDRIVDTIIVQDIRMAADVLKPVFDQTDSLDGWVSIEVPASMAFDTEKTLLEVERLRSLVDRPNVLVKIPATAEGVEAIRRSIARGYSINVTLIFSIDRYREVMEAYLAGLEELIERREAGEDLPEPASVRSVASFFVSRVDTKVDKQLDEKLAQTEDRERRRHLQSLAGQAAVDNARLAYQAFQETFSGERWERLAAAGARVQRPLWGSTSTKNPEYRDVLYVEELIGPHTVNTMPQNTLDAFREHGEVRGNTVLEDVDQAWSRLEVLAEAGVDMAEVTAALEVEGVKAFADSHDEMYRAVEEKRRQMAEGKAR